MNLIVIKIYFIQLFKYIKRLTLIYSIKDKNKEKQCVKDALNILNDAIEKNYPEILEKFAE